MDNIQNFAIKNFFNLMQQKDLKDIIAENYQDFINIVERYMPSDKKFEFELIEHDERDNKFYIFPKDENQFKKEAYQDGNIIVKVFHPNGKKELIYRKITKIWTTSVSWNINSMPSKTPYMKHLNDGSNLTAYACPARYKNMVYNAGSDCKEQDRLQKHKVLNICREHGIFITHPHTHASKNKGALLYWANPYISYLYHDWYLTLDDYINKVLHCFKIPANSIYESQIKVRADITDKIDLQIQYNDDSFTDTRSGLKFSKFLIKSIKY